MHIQRLIAGAPEEQSGRFSEKVMKNPKNFKEQFLSILQDQSSEGNKQCKDIIQNLWSLLDQEVDINSIVNHLRSFDDQLVPKIFSDVVIEDLKN